MSNYPEQPFSYEHLDPAKLGAQILGAETAKQTLWTGVTSVEKYRGSSCSVQKLPDGSHVSHVEEGLGTKIILADKLYAETGDPIGYEQVAQCAVAMIANDAFTVGIPLVSLQMHLAVGG